MATQIISKQVTGANPATLEELKTLLGFPQVASAKDAELSIYLESAYEQVESFTATPARESILTVRLTDVRGRAWLPLRPVLEVVDAGGAVIEPSSGAVVGDYEDVTITYRVGEGGQATKIAVLKCAAYNYETPIMQGGVPEWQRIAKTFSKRSYVC